MSRGRTAGGLLIFVIVVSACGAIRVTRVTERRLVVCEQPGPGSSAYAEYAFHDFADAWFYYHATAAETAASTPPMAHPGGGDE